MAAGWFSPLPFFRKLFGRFSSGNAAPVNVTIPVITGTAQVNQTLTGSNGTWAGNPTSYTYQWNDSVTGPITGATSNTYIVQGVNVGHKITFTVIAYNAYGTSLPATSLPTSNVTPAPLGPAVIITGWICSSMKFQGDICGKTTVSGSIASKITLRGNVL